MIRRFQSQFLLCGVFLALVVASSGCFVFDPLGNALSLGYENTVSYFNAYYNARRLFRDAEGEILAAQLANRGKNQTQPNQIPSGAKQKLTVTIDKCSNILAFHPTSSFVDDALLLIGKSYFYQGEYLKAERKFSELIAQFQSSSLLLEAHLWYAKSEEQLGNDDGAIATCEGLVTSAREKGEEEIVDNAHLIEGESYRHKKQDEKAIEFYAKVVEESASDDLKTIAQKNIADIFFAQEQYEKAARAYLQIPALTQDYYIIYSSKSQAAIALRKLRSFDAGLSLLDEMLNDFRYKENVPGIRFERANILAAQGRRDEAMDEYRLLDTVYARTESGLKAAFEIGRIYENEMGDFQSARTSYSRVASTPGVQIATDARRKYSAITRYLDARQRIVSIDSLVSVLSDTNARMMKDSTRGTVLNRDSLKIAKGLAAFELGEVFYSDLVFPDSAVYWYQEALSLIYGSDKSPRVLYVLAELSRSNPDKHYASAEEFCRRLIRDFPDSPYANAARRILGIAELQQKSDPAEDAFRRAEVQIDSRHYTEALSTLSNIVQQYPQSPLAAKSQYTLGWLYENELARPESAQVHYNEVVQKYKTSQYVQAAQSRSAVLNSSIQPDTTKKIVPSVLVVPVDSVKQKADTTKARKQGKPKVIDE